MKIADIPESVLETFRRGTVIPAHPLALTADRTLDEKHQRALTRYYTDSGAGGIAIGVHTTQFAIRKPEIGLFEPILKLTSETVDDWCSRRGRRILKVAGVMGDTAQALKEAVFARDTGYHACLLSLSALANAEIP